MDKQDNEVFSNAQKMLNDSINCDGEYTRSYHRPCSQGQWNWHIAIIILRTLLLLVTRVYRRQADPYGTVMAGSGNLKR